LLPLGLPGTPLWVAAPAMMFFLGRVLRSGWGLGAATR
jgi:hypothetical protein